MAGFLQTKTCLFCGQVYDNRRKAANSSKFRDAKGWSKSRFCSNSCAAQARCQGQKRSTIERFWAFVEKKEAGHCWPWRGHIFRSGHGGFGLRPGIGCLAHRASFVLAYGEPPKGFLVRHLCGSPGCVNPEHLATGTHRDNSMDAKAHGRQVGRLSLGNAPKRIENRAKRIQMAAELDAERKRLASQGHNPYESPKFQTKRLLELLNDTEPKKPSKGPKKSGDGRVL